MIPVSIDLESALVAWARAAIAGQKRVVTETPANLADVLPVIEITDIGGPDVAVGLDAAMVDVDYYAADRITARIGANAVRDALRYSLPGTTLNGGAVVTRVRTLLRPSWRPYDNTAVRRVGATYQIHLKQPNG